MLEPTQVIDSFFSHLPSKTFAVGEVIFREGEKGDRMYAIMSGEVELIKNGKVVEVISAHDIFGEGTFVQPGGERATTARASKECQIVELNREKFLFLVQETPFFALDVIRSLSSRLRKIKRNQSV